MTITLPIVSPLPRDFETPSVGFIFGLRETPIMREREREREGGGGGGGGCYPSKQTQMGHPTRPPMCLPTPSSFLCRRPHRQRQHGH